MIAEILMVISQAYVEPVDERSIHVVLVVMCAILDGEDVFLVLLGNRVRTIRVDDGFAGVGRPRWI